MLSGGERNRVHLAKTLIEGANVILLDKPTNDLNANTLRALEEALEEFAGTALVVSYDRWLLDRICTHLIVFEGDPVAKIYIGNWSDCEAIDGRIWQGFDAASGQVLDCRVKSFGCASFQVFMLTTHLKRAQIIFSEWLC